MSEFYSFAGLRDGGTFKVDATTKSTISAQPTDIIGKVVTVTGNGEAGYGSDGKAPLGVVQMVEKESTNSEDYVISVIWGRTFEGITCTGSETAGDYLACDGTGGLKKSETYTNCKALSIDTSNNTCAIKID